MELLDLEASLELATRTEDVWRQMVLFAGERSVRRIAYHHLPPPAAPDAPLLRIENEGFGRRCCAVSGGADGAASRPSPTPSSAACGRSISTSSSAAPSCRRPSGRMSPAIAPPASPTASACRPSDRMGATASSRSTSAPTARRLAPETLAELRWAGQAMHLRYSELIVPTLGELPGLSPREPEVLLWVARGKSNAAIGEILGISAHTVDAHLRRVFLKLGVFDRISAALRGLGFGLISLDSSTVAPRDRYSRDHVSRCSRLSNLSLVRLDPAPITIGGNGRDSETKLDYRLVRAMRGGAEACRTTSPACAAICG